MPRLLAATVLAVLLAPATAHAGFYKPADKVRALSPVLQQARAQWPRSECAGRERVAFAPLPAQVMGVADMHGNCTVMLNRRLLRLQEKWLCVAVTHEFGHLAGRDHVVRADRVMHYAMSPMTWGGCDGFLPVGVRNGVTAVPGDRVELLYFRAPSLPVGSLGTVVSVDGGRYLVEWDAGRTQAVEAGLDAWQVVQAAS